MTLITFQDGKVVLRDGKVGTEKECCCEPAGCGVCVQVDYQWSFTENVCGVAATFSGSVRIRSVDGTVLGGEIQCYNDPDVVSVDASVFSGKKMTLNYGQVCGPLQGNAVLEFVCDELSPAGAVIVFAGFLDVIDLPGGLCCGETTGTFSLANELQSLTVTISLLSPGECDCDGYTPVTPS